MVIKTPPKISPGLIFGGGGGGAYYRDFTVCGIHEGKEGLIRKVDVEYKNSNEGIKRVTHRGVRELVIIFPVDELDIYERIDRLI